MRNRLIKGLATCLFAALLVAPAAADIEQEREDAKLYFTAKDLLDEGRLLEAYGIFKNVAQMQNSSYQDDAAYYMAYCLYELESLQEAKTALDAFIVHFKNSSWLDDASKLRTQLLSELSEHGDAIATLQRAAEARRAAEEARDVVVARRSRHPEVEIERDGVIRNYRDGERYYQGEDDCDDEDGTKEMALDALLAMDNVDIVPIVVKFYNSDPCRRLKQKAIFVLSRQESEAALEALINIAKSEENPKVREYAIHWIGQFDDAKAIEALSNLYNSIEDEKAKTRIIYSLTRSDYEDKAIVKLKEIAKTDPSMSIRKHAVTYLSRIDDEEAAFQALKEIYDAKSENEDIRKTAVYSISRLDEESEVINFLTQVAMKDDSRELRKYALYYLARQETKEVVPLFAQIYKSEEDEKLREYIVTMLARTDYQKDSINQLAEMYPETGSAKTKERIVYTLAQLVDEEESAVDKLIAIYNSEQNSELKRKIIYWLGRTDSEKAQQFLMELLEK